MLDSIQKLSKRQKVAQRMALRLRATQTPAERILWRLLRNRYFRHLKFRRQAPVGPYIVDFYCPQHRLIVEVDGDVHALKRRRDFVREQKLKRHGFKVLRFTNSEIMFAHDEVLDRIARCTTHTSRASLSSTGGEG